MMSIAGPGRRTGRVTRLNRALQFAYRQVPELRASLRAGGRGILEMLSDRRRAARFVLLVGRGPLYVAFGRDAKTIAGLIGAPLVRLRVGLLRRTALVMLTPEQCDAVERELLADVRPFAVAPEIEDPLPTGEAARAFVRIESPGGWRERGRDEFGSECNADADWQPEPV